jgi:hypothetical protein
MKFRKVTLFNGKRFTVPQGIQRIDHRATHGWQLRYGGTKLYSDFTQDGSGAAASLELAIKELKRRIAKLPAPSRLQTEASANKQNDLPVGISGPIIRTRRGTMREANLAVLIPRFGLPPQRRSVYIGNENTYTVERYLAALEKAIELRKEAEAAYRRAATAAKRVEGAALKVKGK